MTAAKPATGIIEVLVYNGHRLTREGLRALLEREHGVRVAVHVDGEASDIVHPDVIVVDPGAANRHAADILPSLRSRFPGTGILVLTVSEDPADVYVWFTAGARGCLLKDAEPAEFMQAVRPVARGEDYVQPRVGAALARWRDRGAKGQAKAGRRLTERESDVLRLIAMGYTNAEIASLLGVALRTVEAHRASILRKLRLRTRAELVRYAVRSKLVG